MLLIPRMLPMKNDDNERRLFERADQALYRQKMNMPNSLTLV